MNIRQRNNITLEGADENPIVFVNGFGCTQSVWRNITPAFEENHEIILFDHVGTGRSRLAAFDADKYSKLEAYADDIVEICEYLKLRDVVLVGHSVGAIMGIIAAQKAPQYFKSLVLIGPSPRHLDDKDYNGGFSKESIDELLIFLESDFTGWADHLGKFLMKNSERPQLAKELIDMFCSVPTSVANVFARATFLSDSRHYLSDVQHPTLIIQTTKDALVPLESIQYTHQKIPNSDLKFLHAEGHCPHMSDQQELIDLLMPFVSR